MPLPVCERQCVIQRCKRLNFGRQFGATALACKHVGTLTLGALTILLVSSSSPCFGSSEGIKLLRHGHRNHEQPPTKALCSKRGDAGGGVDMPQTQSIVLLNFVTMLLGTDQTLVKSVECNDMDSALVMALRFSIAALALALATYLSYSFSSTDKSLSHSEPSSVDINFFTGAAELSLWLFLAFFAEALALQYTTASAGALLGSLTVVVVPLLSFLDGNKVSQATWLSVGVALIGCLCFAGAESSLGGMDIVGNGLEMISAVLFAIQIWRCEKITRSVREDQASALTCLQVCFVAILSFACLFLQGFSIPDLLAMITSLPACDWAHILFMGLVTTAFGLWAEARAMRDVDAAPAALIYACEPIWGAAFAFLWRGEEALNSPCAVAGAALLLLASMTASVQDATPSVKPQSISAELVPLELVERYPTYSLTYTLRSDFRHYNSWDPVRY
eukprot:TRINITY_DN31530_c0_g1_i1.p1 TRINITY_DN31530_c0_g1~~TRINITY_DN31530_c0_g1_i1.p1  ORF type:complete len:448 (+),score=50.55 TRINITY_DN31530_c0_g1_i1:39-1382(+)